MKKIEQKISYFIYLNIFYLFIGMLLFKYNFISYQLFSYGEILLLGISLFFIAILLKQKKLKKNIIDFILIILILLEIFNIFFAIKKEWAIFGSIFRHEGILQILYYYSLFYLATYITKESEKEKTICLILANGILNVLFSFEQISLLNLYNPPELVKNIYNYADGLTTHSNFLGTLMVLCFSLSLGYSIFKKKFKNSLLSLAFFVGILLCNCTGSFLTIILLLVSLLVYLLCKKDKLMIIKYLSFILVCIAISMVLTRNNYTEMPQEITKTFFEMKEISQGNMNEEYGTGRMYIWSEIIKNLPTYLWHGTGIDCLLLMDSGPLLDKKSYRFIDKAHNEYLQILITEGIFVFFSYLLFLYVIFINFVKNKKKAINNVLFIAFMTYLIQAFFNIRVIEVAPLFYLISGLLYTRGAKKA